MKICIGKIIKAQGIKGEVKATCAPNIAQMLKGAKTLYVESTPHSVVNIRGGGDFFYVRFADACDRNAAEELCGRKIFCERDALALAEGVYFVDDILGSVVTLDDGKSVGEVCDVLQNGSADVYVCKNGKSTVSFPFLKDLVVSVNTNAKTIVLSAKRFAEVVLDENSEEVSGGDDEN